MKVATGFLGLDAEGWAAIATWVTAGIAGAAAVFAYFQLRHSRQLSEEQAAPYVVVYAEAAIVGSLFFDIVVKNLGKTAARDVRVRFDPPLYRYASDGQAVNVPDIPVLVPGQEYRTFWDSGYARRGLTDLPRQHTAVASFAGSSSGRVEEFVYVVDWDVIAPAAMEKYGEHHAAKALREMSALMKKWTNGSNLRVQARDGDAYDARQREYYEAMSKREVDAEEPSG